MIGHVIGTRNFEHVRRRVAEILDEELENQAIIGYDEDLEIAVYEERITPINYEEKRVVNVRLNSNEFDNFFQLNKDGTISIAVDVYCTYAGDGSLSMKKLQKIIGVIDAILSDSRYKTLGFAKPSISRVQVTGFQISDERVQHDSTNTCLGRVNLEVRVQEQVAAIQPVLLDGYTTRVLISDSNEGYVYENPPCAPGALQIINSDNIVITVEIVNSGASDTYQLDDTPVLVTDLGGNPLGSADLPSVTGGTIQVDVTPTPCLDASYTVEYANGDPIESGTIPSGESETIVVPNCPAPEPCLDSSYSLTLDGTPVDSGTIPSGDNANIPIDAFVPQDLFVVIPYFEDDTSVEVVIRGLSNGTVSSVSTTLTNVTYEVNGVPVVFPFNLQNGDILVINFDSAPTESEITLIGTYA